MIDYQDIEQRVTRRFQRRYRFMLHSVIFVMGILLMGSRMTAEGFFAWTVLWAIHALWMSYQGNLENAIREEIEREHNLMYKAKRDQVFSAQRLHDPRLEGEDWDYQDKQKNG